jgi:hypothetical protein
MNEIHHPGRSSELLSRLHDGEITEAERQAFDAHCEVCPACRAAAEDYERTLSLYRAAPLAPTPSDLSARILRKVRAQSPSRRPFAVTFGIDVRWAGALVAALLVILVSAPLLLRREIAPPGPAPSSPISAHLIENGSAVTGGAPAPPGSSPDDSQARARRSEGRAAPVPEPVAKARPRLREEEPPGRAAAPVPAGAGANEPLSKDEAAPIPSPGRQAASQFAAARESAAAASAERKAQARPETPVVRLVIRPLEGEGSPPAILVRPPDERLLPLRGREFILTVEPSGAVVTVSPATDARDSLDRQLGSRSASAGSDADALREIRFEAGSGILRLRVRVD